MLLRYQFIFKPQTFVCNIYNKMVIKHKMDTKRGFPFHQFNYRIRHTTLYLWICLRRVHYCQHSTNNVRYFYRKRGQLRMFSSFNVILWSLERGFLYAKGITHLIDDIVMILYTSWFQTEDCYCITNIHDLVTQICNRPKLVL